MAEKTKIEATKWRAIEIEFGHILLDSIRDGAHGQKSEKSQDIKIIRKTILFTFGGKLHCTEYIRGGYIDFFFYDLNDDNGVPVIKFHSEPHEQKNVQTETEPFHMHVRKEKNDLKVSARIANHRYQSIWDILYFIETSKYTSYLFNK